MVGVCSVLAVGVGDVRVVTRLLVEGTIRHIDLGAWRFCKGWSKKMIPTDMTSYRDSMLYDSVISPGTWSAQRMCCDQYQACTPAIASLGDSWRRHGLHGLS